METTIFIIAVVLCGLAFIGPRLSDWLRSMRVTDYDERDDYPQTVEQRFRKASDNWLADPEVKQVLRDNHLKMRKFRNAGGEDK